MERFRIGDREFLPEACELRRDHEFVHLQFQVRNVLLCLIRHRGEVVDKATLLREAWGGRRASEESLSRCISLLRRQFDRGDGPSCIETIPKVGYRLRLEDGSPPSRSDPPVACLYPGLRAGEGQRPPLPSANAGGPAWGRLRPGSLLTHAVALIGGALLAWAVLFWLHLP